MSGIKLIVGLANPGKQYHNTRHNAGAWFVAALAEKYGAKLSSNSKFFGSFAKANIAGHEVFLLVPETFMNLSGKSVLAVTNFYKVKLNEVLVIHDELDFNPGVVKLKLGGGSGGHNGLKDIMHILGADFWRLRLGIGHPGNKNMVADYVLKEPSKIEHDLLGEAIERSLLDFERLCSGEFAVFQKELHT